MRTSATYADLVKVPDHLVAELIEGELHTSPRPSGPHTRFASALGMDLGAAYDRGHGGPGGWWILDEPELHLDDNVLVPDLAGWRRERMPRVPQSHIFDVAPDWICEVLSGSTARIDRAKKMPIYACSHVEYAWLAHPIERYVEIKKFVDGRWTDLAVFQGNQILRAGPFELVEIDLASIWGPTDDDDSTSVG